MVPTPTAPQGPALNAWTPDGAGALAEQITPADDASGAPQAIPREHASLPSRAAAPVAGNVAFNTYEEATNASMDAGGCVEESAGVQAPALQRRAPAPLATTAVAATSKPFAERAACRQLTTQCSGSLRNAVAHPKERTTPRHAPLTFVVDDPDAVEYDIDLPRPPKVLTQGKGRGMAGARNGIPPEMIADPEAYFRIVYTRSTYVYPSLH